MSILRPATADDVARWSTRDAAAKEPVAMPLTDLGWSTEEAPRTTSQPNLRVWKFERWVEFPGIGNMERPCDRGTTQQAELARWWDQPLTPGGPMVVASRRTVTTDDGRALEVLTTSQFGGVPRTLDLVFLQGPDWYARVTFDGTFSEDVDAALERLHVV